MQRCPHERPKLKLIAADFFERPVKLRLPFRFGVVTLTEAPQVFVRARIRLADGREGEGVSAELLAPKWFDKSPALIERAQFRSAAPLARNGADEPASGWPRYAVWTVRRGRRRRTMMPARLSG